jgi:pyruvate/2-oxoglutarate dehydrogenase complex dihydrolipoamide dehydrogenase (E3) component
VAAARRDGEDYVLREADERELRAERLLIAAGRSPQVAGLGLETVRVKVDSHGIAVDACLSAVERLWAIGDVNGIWPLTSVGKYQGDVDAANILGDPREADYAAVPDSMPNHPGCLSTSSDSDLAANASVSADCSRVR